MKLAAREPGARSATSTRPVSDLVTLVERCAARSHEWIGRVRFGVGERWYERLERSVDHEVWAISWLPGQGTGFHDHGDSAGAFAVAFGTLQEDRPGRPAHSVGAGQVRAFEAGDVHDVRNTSTAPAISIHAYSPPLALMNRYELEAGGLVPCGTTVEDEQVSQGADDSSPRDIDTVLAAARARLDRLSPLQAHDAVRAGAVLVDIRPAAQRASEGEVPEALIIERNVLEWRLDPASDARLPIAARHDLPVIVLCSAGYASSLAAAALQDVGLFRATDVVGGFQAWRAAGLPTTAAAS
jgi:rhodanese-related sulfurtransferase/predicted metal-dependent enzyme (double-stranded beta helix superfamily)